MPERTAPTLSPHVLRVLPWLVAVAMFMEGLDISILNTAVPVIANDLATTALSLKAVLTTYTLALAIFIPVSGWMADRYGTRRVFRVAVALFTIGSLLCGLSMNLPMLVELDVQRDGLSLAEAVEMALQIGRDGITQMNIS